MSAFIYSLLLFSILLSSCQKADSIIDYKHNEEGEVIKAPYLWKIPMHKEGSSDSGPSIQGNMVFGETSLIRTSESPVKKNLTLIDCSDGARLWDWSDWYQPETEGASFNSYVYSDNILHWATGTRNYWVNLSNGFTHYKIRRETGIRSVIKYDDEVYFAIGDPIDTLEEYQTAVVLSGNFVTGELKQILVPEFNLENAIGNRIGQVTSIIPIKKDTQTLLIVAYQEIFPNWEFVSYLGLFNMSEKVWIYDKIKLNEKSQKGVLYQPMKLFDGSVILTVGNALMCYDYLTGEKIWERQFPHDFSFSGFEVADGVLVANCENLRIYGLDPGNGNILWENEGSGTSSNLLDRIMNGVAYFSGGGPNRIFAVDIHTGEILWRLDPREYESSNAYWTWDIYVVPSQHGGMDKVIACSGTHAYCFEAAR